MRLFLLQKMLGLQLKVAFFQGPPCSIHLFPNFPGRHNFHGFHKLSSCKPQKVPRVHESQVDEGSISSPKDTQMLPAFACTNSIFVFSPWLQTFQFKILGSKTVFLCPFGGLAIKRSLMSSDCTCKGDLPCSKTCSKNTLYGHTIFIDVKPRNKTHVTFSETNTKLPKFKFLYILKTLSGKKPNYFA